MDHDQLARSGPGSQGTEGGRGRRTVGPATGGLRGRWGNLVAAAVLAAMALAGIVTGIVSGLDSPAASTGAPGPSSRSVVLTAVDSTVGAKTADVHLTLQLSVPGGGSVTATGDGQVDFTAGSSSLAVDYRGTALPAPGTLTVVYVGGSAYLSLPLVSQFAPGRSWVGAAVGGSDLLTGGADPAALFQVLETHGATVTSLGPSTVDGVAVDGYHVVVAPAAAQRTARTDARASRARSMFGTGEVSADVYVGRAAHIVQRVVADVSVGMAGHALTGTVTEDTANLGTPVSITAPPADQVVALQQIRGALDMPTPHSGA